jgi:hypothetical protein
VPDRASDARRFFRACAVGGVLAGLLFAWMLVEGHPTRLFDKVFFGNFYEAQARAWLHFRWEIPRADLSQEAFIVDGKAYTYFGPWPAVLRLPFVLFTDGLDGRLAALSMLVAFGVALFFTARLLWHARTSLRGGAPITRAELVFTALCMIAIGAGSSMLFLAGQAWVFHEAIMWGVALALASVFYLLRYLRDGGSRDFVLAALTATLALLSRATLGLAPLIAIGLVLAARVITFGLERWRGGEGDRSEGLLQACGIGERARSTPVWQLATAIVAPLAVYASVNWSKFGSLSFRPPFDRQLLLLDALPTRQAALDANGGNLFGLKFVPTNFLAYWRPDGIAFDNLFPWVTFRRHTTVIGDLTYDAIHQSASITIVSLILLLLGAFGVFYAVRGRAAGDRSPLLTEVRLPLVAALVAAVAGLSIAEIAHRYEADFLPFLVIAAIIGFDGLMRATATWQRRRKVGMATVFAAVTAWSVLATTAVTLQYQRMYRDGTKPETMAAFVDTQLDVRDVLGGSISAIDAGASLPDPHRAGSFFVIGGCDGLYWSDGDAWHPLEETAATGLHRLRIEFASARKGRVEPILTIGKEDGAGIVLVQRLAHGRVRFSYQWTGGNPSTYPWGRAVTLPSDRRLDALVFLRRDEHLVQVQVGGEEVFGSAYTPVPIGRVELARREVPGRGRALFTGDIDELPSRRPLCRRVVAASDL